MERETNPILQNLNDPQYEAVTTTEGPLLVLAGAGSGKTRVLTRRIAYLLEQGLARRGQVMAVTFTNKASREMQERITEICGPGRFPHMGTFHSVCSRWLREDGEAVGLSRRYVIYASDEQKALIRQVIQDLEMDSKKYAVNKVLSRISRWKNNLWTPAQAIAQARSYFDVGVAKAYHLYQELLDQYQAVDFDDILLKTVEMLRDHPEIRERYQQKIHYMLIDEYQDVNPVQYELTRWIVGDRRNLCAVGDDDQSIYAFRGADVSIILRFEEDFQDAKIIKLEQNYRSSLWILRASNELVSHNHSRKAKSMWTDQQEGTKLVLNGFEDAHAEARFISREMLRLKRQEGRSFEDMAVLYRTNAQSRILEEAILAAGIPYRLVGGLRFFERKEVKDTLAYLQVLLNPRDDLSMRRIINVPTRGIGATSVARLQHFADERELSLYKVMADCSQVKMPKRAHASIKHLHGWLEELYRDLSERSVTISTAVERVLDKSGYRQALEDENSPESQARLDNLQELLNVTAEYDKNAMDPSLDDFMTEVALLSEQDMDEETKESVTLMTLHASKGLEFAVVFLAGLEEETLPHARSMEDDDDICEERRLCYVGMTRAQECLYLSYSKERLMYGKVVYKLPSRFLKEMPQEAFAEGTDLEEHTPERVIDSTEWKGFGRTAKEPYSKGQLSPLRSQEKNEFEVGQEVVHKAFGEGEVLAVSGDIVSVLFAGEVKRKLRFNFLSKKGEKRPPVTRKMPEEEKQSKSSKKSSPSSSKVAVKKREEKPESSSIKKESSLKRGQKINHPRWGSGVVKTVHPDGTILVIFRGITLNLPEQEVNRLMSGK